MGQRSRRLTHYQSNCEDECATRQQLRQFVEGVIVQHTCSVPCKAELE